MWDRFHLIQRFNEALNEDRRNELANIDPEGEMGDLMNNKYRYLFCKRDYKRSNQDKKHIAEVMRLNDKITKMEIIKEQFHSMFNCNSVDDAKIVMAEVYEWSMDANCANIFEWVKRIRE